MIRASSSFPTFLGFGISFSSSPVDVDDNKVSDVAIGAHTSGDAVVVRARPTVFVDPVPTASIDVIEISNIKGEV